MNENQVGVILEEVRDMFKTLAEGQKVMEKDIADLKQGQQVMQNDIVELKLGQQILQNRLDSVENDVKFIKTYVMKVDDELNDHERRISSLEMKAVEI